MAPRRQHADRNEKQKFYRLAKAAGMACPEYRAAHPELLAPVTQSAPEPVLPPFPKLKDKLGRRLTRGKAWREQAEQAYIARYGVGTDGEKPPVTHPEPVTKPKRSPRTHVLAHRDFTLQGTTECGRRACDVLMAAEGEEPTCIHCGVTWGVYNAPAYKEMRAERAAKSDALIEEARALGVNVESIVTPALGDCDTCMEGTPATETVTQRDGSVTPYCADCAEQVRHLIKVSENREAGRKKAAATRRRRIYPPRSRGSS